MGVSFVRVGKRGSSDSGRRAAPALPRGLTTFFPFGRTTTKPRLGRQSFSTHGEKTEKRCGAGFTLIEKELSRKVARRTGPVPRPFRLPKGWEGWKLPDRV